MLLTVTTTHRPADDLGYLLVKHPDKVHDFSVPTGTAYVFFPEVSAERCTAALLLDTEPTGLSRAPGSHSASAGSSHPAGDLGTYVNDRPYAASSLLAAALAKVFRSALRGTAPERPELAGTPIPLEITVPALAGHGGPDLAGRLFTPLGWEVTATPVPLDRTHPEWGASRYVSLTLRGTLRLSEALNHIYVLLPVLDDAKHYWVAPDEIDKLLRAGQGWLAGHPERRLIITRYLAHRKALTATVYSALSEVDDTGDEPEDAGLPVQRVSLARQRVEAVLAALASCGAASVLDLGCGPGALLAELVKERRYPRVTGVDVSIRALALAARRLRLDRYPARATLLQSALTYKDQRLTGYDAAVLMEVIEHVDPPRLPALVRNVFGHARPRTVIVTTPNVEYNVRYPGLAGHLRHHDHRFEWTRAQFAGWTARVCAAHGYTVTRSGVGSVDDEVGAPTQLAVFTREATGA